MIGDDNNGFYSPSHFHKGFDHGLYKINYLTQFIPTNDLSDAKKYGWTIKTKLIDYLNKKEVIKYIETKNKWL